MKILIAEDDQNMCKILQLYLLREGYQVEVALDGEAAAAYFESDSADLLLLDWMMPKKDGMEVCREIRRLNIPVKIIMLTAKTAVADELQGLTAGADDYIKKPFDMKILLVKIKKLLNLETVLTSRDITLNPATFEVIKNGQKLDLTRKEYDLLKYFLSNQRRILSREQILNQVWGLDYMGDVRTVDTHIRRLRQKIGDAYIKTAFGTGYIMEDGG